MARRPWTHDQLVAGPLAVLRELYPETGSAFTIGITAADWVASAVLREATS